MKYFNIFNIFCIIFCFVLHNNIGDNMNLDIRTNVINKMKNDKEQDIIKTLNESVITNDELILPGLGVMLELFWNKLNDNERMNIANIIKNSIQNM